MSTISLKFETHSSYRTKDSQLESLKVSAIGNVGAIAFEKRKANEFKKLAGSHTLASTDSVLLIHLKRMLEGRWLMNVEL